MAVALGLRDPGLLESALFCPRHLTRYAAPDLAALAAAYGFGLARNHLQITGTQN
jgi:death on curing protein